MTIDDEGARPSNRSRRRGNFLLAFGYQPATWMIATLLQGATAVCYDQACGGQSARRCAGGLKTSDSAENPLVNKFPRWRCSSPCRWTRSCARFGHYHGAQERAPHAERRA